MRWPNRSCQYHRKNVISAAAKKHRLTLHIISSGLCHAVHVLVEYELRSLLEVIVLFLPLLLAASLLMGAHHPLPQSPSEAVPVTDQDRAGEKQQETGKHEAAIAKPVVTKHKVSVAGKEISYTAMAGQLPILNEAGEADAHVFFIAYTVSNDSVPRSERPLLFIFNGGPGASAVWLHLGIVGPRRVLMLTDGSMPPSPYKLVDNEFTWLDKADLVFIDPVGTGYSRAVKPDLTKKFTSVQGDIDSMGRFIRLYLTRYERWSSPLFLVGESYGTFRVAGLSEYLIEHGIALDGIIMISSIMNLQTTSFDNGNDLPYVLFLPSYAATAWYHKKLTPQTDLGKTLKAAEEWATTDYLIALGKGDRLSSEERHVVVEKLAGFTGLDKTFIDNRNLRIDRKTFANELLGKQGKTIGFMDSRLTAPNLDPAVPLGFDPTVATIRPPFTATFNGYVRNELGFQSDLEYFTLGGGIEHWDWEAKNRYADTSDNLRNTFAKNPYMRVFIASGYFDIATPYFATEYTLAHLALTPRLRDNITTTRYRSGHMIYLDASSISQLKRDVEKFIGGALVDGQ
jgi:carboxypeptidase C (cathepsin A)